MSTKPYRVELTPGVKPVETPKFRVLVADRDSMSSQSLAAAIAANCGYEAAAIPSSELLRTLATRESDLVVIGADPKSSFGFDLASALYRAYPKVALVILLDQPTRAAVINAFRAGARGVFSRQQSVEKFLDCIEHVSQGSIWAGTAESTFLLEAFRSIPAPVVSRASDGASLTKRELQVVQSAARGRTNKRIASELGLSEHTVKNYLYRAFEKLGVSSRMELLFYLTIEGHTFTRRNSDRAGDSPV